MLTAQCLVPTRILDRRDRAAILLVTCLLSSSLAFAVRRLLSSLLLLFGFADGSVSLMAPRLGSGHLVLRTGLPVLSPVVWLSVLR